MLAEFMYKGFPETIDMEEHKAREYVRELIAERIIYRDIPETFRIEDFAIIKILACTITSINFPLLTLLCIPFVLIPPLNETPVSFMFKEGVKVSLNT